MDPKAVDFGWNGVHRSSSKPPGVYVWMAEIDGCDGKKVLLKGDVTVIR